MPKQSIRMRRAASSFLLIVLLGVGSQGRVGRAQETLESSLLKRPVSDLAKRARILGDAARGAAIFHRQGLSCTQCHSLGSRAELLGPDLSEMRERGTYEQVIESVLQPSKVVRDGFKMEQIVLADGRVLTAMVRSATDNELVVAVPGEEELRRLVLSDVEERIEAISLMPGGLVNQLVDEGEFFDLIRFLVELGRAGPNGAERLKLAQAAMIEPLPDYEQDLDHAGLISQWNAESLARGAALYDGLCVNCHGTRERPGSLPNALQFAKGRFRNGADPLSMYKTLTHGYRLMAPQRQLVPRQKYDVIHYIRETFLSPFNESQYVLADARYLSGLPTGSKRGPTPLESEPWRDMDYGPFLINTYEIVGPDTQPRPVVSREEEERGESIGKPPNERWPANTNFAYKGIAIRLDDGPGGVSAGSHWLAFDHDTMRIAGAWSGEGFIDWEGILLNGRHRIAPRTVGEQHFANPPGPGWAHPKTGSCEDPRLRGRDGRLFGPLPRDWAHYKGLYKHGNRVVVSYTVGRAAVLESHRLEYAPAFQGETAVWVRTLNVGQSTDDLTLRVVPTNSAAVAITGPDALKLSSDGGYQVVRIAAADTPVNFELRIATTDEALANRPNSLPEDLRRFTKGGPSQWPELPPAIPEVGTSDVPFAVDELTRPTDNRWRSRLRMSGLDFFADGDRLVACCCDGDVWIVQGIDKLGEVIRWRRIASGLFQPLGIKIIGGRIFVTCRDQIVILNDLNGDGEADYYESFNNDHQVTDHFHEFAMGLQVDGDGNLYYAKSARHARDSLVPHHGTLLQVSADGLKTTILANGFRAANGVCLNPDGSFFVTDQEGHWTPMNRINRVLPGRFYGNMYSYGAPADIRDQAMERPLCWPNKEFDRSPAELVWVDSDKWGPLTGSLLNLSYGYGKVYVVPHEQVDGYWQGGMSRLPLPDFPTGIMRARFHPGNGQLYACGMYAWASSQTATPGGLYRLRYTGQPVHLPVGLQAHRLGMTITFTEPLDRQMAENPDNYLVETWSLKRTARYGSDRYGETVLPVAAARLSADGRSVMLEIPRIRPTWCMQIAYTLRDSRGSTFRGLIQNTVHRLRAPAKEPSADHPD